MITTVCKISYGSQTVPPIVPAVQGDTGRAISFEIADFTPPAGATATYFILKPSGEAIYNSATITDNSILCELTAQSLAEAGENRMQVRVLHGEDIVTSFEVILMVRTFLGDDAIQSGTEMNIFDQAVEQATEQFQTNAEQVVEEVIESIPADYTELTEEVDELNERIGEVKEDFSNLDITVNGKDAEITYVENEYVVNTTGAFASFNGWSRTDYLDLTGLEVFEYSNTGIAAPYNCFYDANKSPLSYTTLQNTTGSYLTIPTGAKYFAYSNPTNQIQLIKWLNSPHTDGLIDNINTIDAKIPETPKIVMIPKIVKIVGTQYDVHYDNIFVNYRSKDIPFKEVFGSFYGIGMDDIVRFQNDVVGTFTGVVRYRSSITDSFNALTMPSNVLRQAFTVQVIPTTSGSGITRKVLLIGDSWTAPGIYARELRTLFESADEPMNITLLGTLGIGGAYVGAENGYHEGHGAYSAKSFCTVAEKNGYTNAFYNPTTETFDFAYYMNNCGYDGVDDVFINLGINDVAEIADYDEAINYWNIMVNSIKAYNSNIKVFIGLCGLPAQYEYGTNNNNCNRSKARRLLFHEKLMEEYGDRESEGFIIVPLHLSIDSEHDFPTVQMARSYRDSTLVDYCTDYVHPTAIAYNKVADTIRAYIKYAETL